MANSIDDLKSEIIKRGGIARTNRFNVIMTPPSQALINIDIGVILSSLARNDFNKNQLVNDPRTLSLICESATIPSLEIGVQTDINTDTYSSKRAISKTFGNVDFSFLVTNDFYVKRMFDDWVDMIIDENYRLGYKDEYTCDVTIQQLNLENEPIYGVTLYNAFPTSIGAMQLTSAADGESKVTISMAYDKYVVESGIGSSLSAVRNAIPKSIF